LLAALLVACVMVLREGHVEEAIAAFRQMIRRSPDLHRGYESLAACWCCAETTRRRSIL
jgi:hypothetical protein